MKIKSSYYSFKQIASLRFCSVQAYLAMALLLVSCAQMVPLTGGDKDVLPPKEIKSEPVNGSLLFASKSIVIEFDEFIKLNNLASQLIVSPLMDPVPEVSIKGKKLVIKLAGELKDSTTYSVNFGNAIQDITENNTYPNYKYVFSTGTYIDSLSYSGTVVNAFDLTKKDKIYVLLYDQLEDSVPLKELPRYIAITDKEGAFSISNIAPGKYKFFAINDINSNYFYDLPNEEIAFKKKIISLDTSSSNNLVYLFEEENGIQYLKKAENKEYGKVALTFNLPTNNLRVIALNQFFKKKWYLEEKSENGDSLTLWLTTTEGVETLELLVKDGETIIDTTVVTIMDKKEFKDTSLHISTSITGSFDLNQEILLTTNRPVINKIISNIKLFENSAEVLFDFKEVENTARKFKLIYDFKENTNYQLLIPPSTFIGIYDLSNDTIKVDFKTKKLSDYGTIFLKITPYFTDDYIIQLYNGKKLVQENPLKDRSKIDYKYLQPGKYQLKLIIDSNKDNKWNTGNYLDHLQPEKVIFYEKDITIRANWDNEVNWIIKK